MTVDPARRIIRHESGTKGAGKSVVYLYRILICHNQFVIDFLFNLQQGVYKILLYSMNFKFTLSELEDEDDENGGTDSSSGRFVRYQFTPAFLRLRTVGAT